MKSYIVCFTILFAGIVYVQADTSAIPTFEAAQKQALENLEILVKKFQELTGIQTEFDKAKVEQYIKTNFGKTQEKIQELLKNIEKDSGKYGEDFKKGYESFVKQINESIKNFNTPEIQGKFKNVQDSFQTGVKKFAESAGELAKSAGVAAPPSIQKSINDIIDEISKTSHKVSEKVNQIVTDAQAELKKKQAKSS